MQPFDREGGRKAGDSPFHPAAEQRAGAPLNLVPTAQGTLLRGPGGGSVESLNRAFGNMFADAPERAVPGKGTKEQPTAPPKQVPGVYPGVKDLTGDYGALAAGQRSSTQGVVLHRTESTTAAGTLGSYKDRINSGSNIGAQYLIDEKGGTNLVTPLDSMVYHAKGFNSSTVGVEVVGPAKKLDRTGAKQPLRDQIAGMNLSPEFEARLLGYNDKQLNNVVKWNGDQIYEDINGAQKRSVWNLTGNLANEYGLDRSSLSQHGRDESGSNNYTTATLPDFSAHEHINPKALGEAEPMIEFLRARQQYPQLVAQAEQKLAALRTSGADPVQIARLEAQVRQEQGTLGALNLDGNAAEMAALTAERDSGKPGEASARENQRTTFYDNFYDRVGALKTSVK